VFRRPLPSGVTLPELVMAVMDALLVRLAPSYSGATENAGVENAGVV